MGLTASGYVQAVVRVPVITPNGVGFSFLFVSSTVTAKMSDNKTLLFPSANASNECLLTRFNETEIKAVS